MTISAFGQTLNNSILRAQKKAINSSPYLDAKHFVIPKYQTKFRLIKFPKKISAFLFEKTILSDTLWIVESFDEMCRTCWSYSADILYKDSLFSYNNLNRDSIDRKQFTSINFQAPEISHHYIISEIVDRVRKKQNWLNYPLQYGSNFCADGDHTLVTIIYPDKHIEAIYVRCWEEAFYRKRQ